MCSELLQATQRGIIICTNNDGHLWTRVNIWVWTTPIAACGHVFQLFLLTETLKHTCIWNTITDTVMPKQPSTPRPATSCSLHRGKNFRVKNQRPNSWNTSFVCGWTVRNCFGYCNGLNYVIEANKACRLGCWLRGTCFVNTCVFYQLFKYWLVQIFNLDFLRLYPIVRPPGKTESHKRTIDMTKT